MLRDGYKGKRLYISKVGSYIYVEKAQVIKASHGRVHCI